MGPISAHFFMRVMDSAAARSIAGPSLLIAGLSAMTAGMLGVGDVIHDFSGPVAALTALAGVGVSALGARMALGYSFFSPAAVEPTSERHSEAVASRP